MFQKGKEYTRDQIHAKVRGSKQAYLPTSSGQVVAVCIKPEWNLKQPLTVICGSGPIISSSGKKLSTQTNEIPVFIKADVNCWKYEGNFIVEASYTTGAEFRRLVENSNRDLKEVTRAIKLRAVG